MNSFCEDRQNRDQLSKLVYPGDPDAVKTAVFDLLKTMKIDEKLLAQFEIIFNDIKDLYAGKYSGYRKCDTEYHDLRHTTDVLLAAVRLVDAARLSGEAISDNGVFHVAVAALMHDTGYIPEIDDPVNSGAEYTLDHVERGIDFLWKYMLKNGYTEEAARQTEQIVLATELTCPLKKVKFVSPETKRLSLMLGAADLLGQMADRIYLEKLLFLYKEFKAGNIPGFESEEEVLKKTVQFYRQMKKRLQDDLDGVDQLMIHHFRERHGINSDLYQQGMEKNIKYLNFILEKHSGSHRNLLRRDGLISKL